MHFVHTQHLDEGRYHSPFFVVAQGSCSGKTFLVLKSGTIFPLAYINLRSKLSPAPPPRTEVIADLFLGLRSTEEVLLFYLCFFEEVLSRSSIRSVSDYSNSVMHKEFWEAIKHRFQKGKGSASGMEMSLNSLVRHIQVRNEAVKDAISLPPNGVFLFAIDEARSMLDVHSPRAANSLFFKWTRAISYLQNMNIFFVLLDTTSKLSTFQPSIFLDPSIRIQTGSLLFHPFYFYPFTGPWPLDDSKEVLTIASDRPASIADVSYDVLLPAKFSRPEFFRIAKLNTSAPFQCYESMLSFAVVKLLNQIEAEGKGRSMSAVLSSKFALVPLEYEDAEDCREIHSRTNAS
jgi:hypothetical protein